MGGELLCLHTYVHVHVAVAVTTMCAKYEFS